MMSILSCGRNTGHQLRVSVILVKLGSVVIDIIDINSDNHFSLSRTFRSFPFNVESVEEERHLLGRLGGGSLKHHGSMIVFFTIKQTIQFKNFDAEPMLNILII